MQKKLIKKYLKMAKIKGDILVDIEECKGCSLCVTACPLKIIALSKKVNSKGYNYAYLIKQDACIGCADCATVCPDSVITVYRTKI